MHRIIAWTLTWGALAGLVVQVPQAALAQTPAVAFDECRNLSDTDIRDRIRELATTNLKTELTAIDYAALVNAQWAKADVNGRIDREVDAAIAAVRADTGYFDRAYSTVSKSSAGRYATAVAEKAYNSDGFKAALGDVASGVAKDVGAQIVRATAKVSNPIIACVQTALQSRYGNAVTQVFVQESQKNLEATLERQPGVKIETSDLVANNAASLSGIMLLVTSRILARIAQSIGQRIAGLIASRIASAVTGLIGLALIAKDLYEAGEGVFPIIAERMKSEETKDIIRSEVGKTIQADISSQVDAIAQETAERIYGVWLDFKQKYNRLLTLGDKSPAFADFLKLPLRGDQIGRLAEIVDVVYGSEGEDGVLKRLADGSLSKALLNLTDAGLTIAADQKSIDKALRWTAVAGKELPRVVDLGLYRWLSPDGITTENLQKLLSLNDKIALSRIANLDPEARDLILNLPADQMRDFARKLNDKQLTAFADYQRHLQPGAARRLLRAVSEDPAIMQQLSGEGLKDAILDSHDQLVALNMVMREDDFMSWLFSSGHLAKDLELVRSGTVSYRVFWQVHWLSVLIAALVLVLFLSWLRRLLFGSRKPK